MNRRCIDCQFFKLPTNTCFLVYMNMQDAPHGNGSVFCKYSDKQFHELSKQTIELRGGHALPLLVRGA